MYSNFVLSFELCKWQALSSVLVPHETSQVLIGSESFMEIPSSDVMLDPWKNQEIASDWSPFVTIQETSLIYHF